jgi:ABC-type uncharacterized transport system involved in gliding motility auxiliary subunit
MKIGSKFVAAILLLVALILINYLAAKVPLRVDATADQVYTLSPGTKTLLGKIDEPVELDFYFSRSIDGLPIGYKNFAVRVQEMLRQYVRGSHGKIHLNVIDPKPDTPEEEKATAAGLTPQRLSTGDRVFFGLVAIQADQQKVIATFTPQREQFLEYDLSQLIYTVQQVDKKKLGLLSSLPLKANPNPMMMMRQSQQESQFVISEWERTFDITSVEPSAAELPANLDALAVIHPENLSPKLQYAIDQFILSGKPVFIAVDPTSQYFKRQGGQQAMYGGPTPNVSSDLPVLFKAYGIEYNPQIVVGDLENASEVQTTDGQVVRYPIWLALTKQNVNAKTLPTAQLNSLLFIEAGDLRVKPQKDLTVTPLIETSAQTGELQSMMLTMAQPDEVARQVKPDGKKTLAVLIQGKLPSAFPNGAPEEPKPQNKKSPTPTPAPTKSAHLTESKTTSTLIVVADTDWLLDDYSVQMFGRNMASPINDNLAFASNSLEFLSGSQDLISIRGKGSTLRPFVVVKNMEVAANEKYQVQLTALETRLADVEKKLSDLQGKKGDSSHLLASPEATKTIDEFRQQEVQMHAQRREIRKALRDKIESLGDELLAINLIVPALLLLIFGYAFNRSRRQAA